MPGKLQYACVGAGGVADWKHLAGYSKIGEVEIVAICDANVTAAESLANKYHIPHFYRDYTEMLMKHPLDLISICTPNFLHMPVTMEALTRGIHVHCEKPLAMNALEAEQMVAAKNKAGKKLMVALNNRFTNESYLVRKCAVEGIFGEIYHVKCGWRRRRGIPGWGGWFTDKKRSGGGPLIDLGVHFLDLAMYFMGYPKAQSVSGATYTKFADPEAVKSRAFSVEDLSVGFLRLENGAAIDFEFSWASNIEKEYNYYEILGSKGGACFKNGELKIFGEMGGACIDILPDVNSAPKNMGEFEHFLDCIKNGCEPLAKPEEAVELMKIIDAVYQSAELKKEIIL